MKLYIASCDHLHFGERISNCEYRHLIRQACVPMRIKMTVTQFYQLYPGLCCKFGFAFNTA